MRVPADRSAGTVLYAYCTNSTLTISDPALMIVVYIYIIHIYIYIRSSDLWCTDRLIYESSDWPESIDNRQLVVLAATRACYASACAQSRCPVEDLFSSVNVYIVHSKNIITSLKGLPIILSYISPSQFSLTMSSAGNASRSSDVDNERFLQQVAAMKVAEPEGAEKYGSGIEENESSR